MQTQLASLLDLPKWGYVVVVYLKFIKHNDLEWVDEYGLTGHHPLRDPQDTRTSPRKVRNQIKGMLKQLGDNSNGNPIPGDVSKTYREQGPCLEPKNQK